MKVDDVLLLRIASHSRQDISERLLITSDTQQHGMFSTVTPRAKRARSSNWRTHDTAEIDCLVNQLCFLGRAHACDCLFEFQICFCVGTYDPDVERFLCLLRGYCCGPTEQQYERK